MRENEVMRLGPWLLLLFSIPRTLKLSKTTSKGKRRNSKPWILGSDSYWILNFSQEKDTDTLWGPWEAEVFTYAPNIGAPQYVRQMLMSMKGEINKNTIILGDFNTSLTPMDRSTKQNKLTRKHKL